MLGISAKFAGESEEGWVCRRRPAVIVASACTYKPVSVVEDVVEVELLDVPDGVALIELHVYQATALMAR